MSGYSGTGGYVDFWMYRDNYGYFGGSGYGDSISVYLSTTANSITAPAARFLGRVARSSQIAIPNTTPADGWYEYHFNYPATGFTGATNYVIFVGDAEFGNDMTIDDVNYTSFPFNPCTGTPAIPVITTPVILTPLCGGGSTTITANDPTVAASNITYQWQSSANSGGPWTNITGQTTLTCTTPALTSTTWFRIKNTCNNSGLSDSSAAFQVPVLNIAVQSVNNATRCGPGSVTLSATGNGTLRWWDQPVAGTQLATGNTYTTPSLNATTTYYVDATNGTCTGTRLPVLAVIVSTVSASVSISSNPNTSVCSGSQVLFTATPTNGGVPSYQWQKNGVNVGTNSSNYADYTLANGDVMSCIMTTSAACAISPTVASNAITAAVTPSVFPAVSISSNAGAVICPSTAVTFTAVPANGGIAPVYQWKKNGFNVGAGPTYNDNNLHNNDIVICTMTSSANCANPGLVGSNPLTISVLNSITPSVAINTAPGTEVCQGTNTTFSANAVGSGTNPVYVWKKNGSIVGGNTPAYSDNALASGDLITLDMTSNANCASPLNASANPVTMTVDPLVSPSIAIAATPSNSICGGTAVTFFANITNGGNSPAYQWKVNGLNMGTNSPSFTSNTLANGNAVTCVLTTSACAAVPTLSSTPINMTVNAAPAANVSASGPTTICAGQPLALTATPAAGIIYQWLLNNANIPGANANSFAVSNSGSYQLMVTDIYTDCSSTSAPIAVTVNPLPPSAITYPGNGTFCANGSLTLTGSAGAGLSYQWFNNGVLVGSSNPYNTSVAGSFVLITNNGTCTDTSVAVSISTIPLPDPTITVTGNTLWVSPGLTYQWLSHGQPIPNATNYVYVATQPGDYSVIITNSEGCSDTSILTSITHDVLSVNNLSLVDEVTLFPNPNDGDFKLAGSIVTKQGAVAMEITDVTGRTIYTTSLQVTNGKVNQPIHLDPATPSGTYIIRISTESNRTILPFTKR
jgi:hypothetical protein